MFNIQYDIYKLLKEAQKDDEILQHFNIQFPSRQIAESSNSIFVGLSEARATARTHTSQNYEELIDIIIVTKQTKYFEASKIYDAVTNIILNILRQDDRYKDRLNWSNFTHRYNPTTNELQLSELLINIRADEQFYTELAESEQINKVNILDILTGFAGDRKYEHRVTNGEGTIINNTGNNLFLTIEGYEETHVISPNTVQIVPIGTYDCYDGNKTSKIRINHEETTIVGE